MEFDAIGSIVEGGTIGPLLHYRLEEIGGEEVIEYTSDGPFGSTSDYLSHFVDQNRTRLFEVRDILANYLASHGNSWHLFDSSMEISMVKISSSLIPNLAMGLPLHILLAS